MILMHFIIINILYFLVVNPSYVVGVVGIGHIPGIKENWGKVTETDIPLILR